MEKEQIHEIIVGNENSETPIRRTRGRPSKKKVGNETNNGTSQEDRVAQDPQTQV